MPIAAAIKQSNDYRNYRSSAIEMIPTAYYRLGETEHGTAYDEHLNSLTNAPFDAAHNGDGSGNSFNVAGPLVKDNNGALGYDDTDSGNYGGASDASSALGSLAAFTISYWAKITASDGNIPACRIGTGAQFNYRLYTTASAISWWQNDGTTRSYSVASTQTLGVWYHVCGVRQSNGLDVELFRNGSSIGSDTVPGVAPTTNQSSLRIGSLTATAQEAHSSAADELLLFHRALSDTEVLMLYLAGRDGVTQ